MKTSSTPSTSAQAMRVAKEDGVAGRHIGDRHAGTHGGFVAVFRHGRVARQSAAAEGAEIDRHHAVFLDAVTIGERFRCRQFMSVPLPVIERHRINRRIALMHGNGEAGGGIQAAGEQNDSGAIGHPFKYAASRRVGKSKSGESLSR
ncbi:MAG: hypothetical protein QM754_06700 [Tepidisphaeraceae bacterium]